MNSREVLLYYIKCIIYGRNSRLNDYYKILGIPKNATRGEIETAYQEKLIKSKKVKDAYNTLINNKSKVEYDKKLQKDDEKNLYEIMGVDVVASSDKIKEVYNQLIDSQNKNKDENKKEVDLQELKQAYDILSDPKKRALYNIQEGNFILQKKAKMALITDINELFYNPNNEYDNYVKELNIRKCENKMMLLMNQIELVYNSRDKDRFVYRKDLTELISRLEKAYQQYERLKFGKTTFINKILKRTNEKELISSLYKTSMKKISKYNTDSSKKTMENIKIRIFSGFWKFVKNNARANIKLRSNVNWWIKEKFVIERKPMIKIAQNILKSEDEFNQDCKDFVEELESHKLK